MTYDKTEEISQLRSFAAERLVSFEAGQLMHFSKLYYSSHPPLHMLFNHLYYFATLMALSRAIFREIVSGCVFTTVSA